jgi:hypothetical protein
MGIIPFQEVLGEYHIEGQQKDARSTIRLPTIILEWKNSFTFLPVVSRNIPGKRKAKERKNLLGGFSFRRRIANIGTHITKRFIMRAVREAKVYC